MRMDQSFTSCTNARPTINYVNFYLNLLVMETSDTKQKYNYFS